ncbi:MAG: hypothetical protein KKH11_00405 [Candidatus Omnitrophica bacterium]|nr:hypothetical protein [Candidatus Omnitrophota bacterium]
MADKEKGAFWEGAEDRESHDKQDVASQFLNNIVNPDYDPPKGHEDAYRSGWHSKDRS